MACWSIFVFYRISLSAELQIIEFITKLLIIMVGPCVNFLMNSDMIEWLSLKVISKVWSVLTLFSDDMVSLFVVFLFFFSSSINFLMSCNYVQELAPDFFSYFSATSSLLDHGLECKLKLKCYLLFFRFLTLLYICLERQRTAAIRFIFRFLPKIITSLSCLIFFVNLLLFLDELLRTDCFPGLGSICNNIYANLPQVDVI